MIELKNIKKLVGSEYFSKPLMIKNNKTLNVSRLNSSVATNLITKINTTK